MLLINHTNQPQGFSLSRLEKITVPRARNGSPGSLEVEAHVIDALRDSKRPAAAGFKYLTERGLMVVQGEAPKAAKK